MTYSDAFCGLDRGDHLWDQLWQVLYHIFFHQSRDGRKKTITAKQQGQKGLVYWHYTSSITTYHISLENPNDAFVG